MTSGEIGPTPPFVATVCEALGMAKRDLSGLIDTERQAIEEVAISSGATDKEQGLKLPKRGGNLLEKEVKEYLDNINWAPGHRSSRMARAINTQDTGKYRPTSRQAVEGTKIYVEYKSKQKENTNS